MAKINSLFKMLQQQGASDLHISSGAPPMFRLHGEMVPLNYPPLSHDQAKNLLYEILYDHQKKDFEETSDLDFAYELPGVARFRGNVLMTHRGIAAVRCRSLVTCSGADQTYSTTEGAGGTIPGC